MTRSEVRWIARLWSPFTGVLVLIASLTLVSTIVHVSLPLILKRIFDGLKTSLTAEALVGAVVLYLVLGTIDWALAGFLVFLRGTMNIRFEWAARQQAYARLVRHGPAFFRRYRTGDLVTRLTDDVSEKLSWFICSGIFRAIAAGGVIVFAIAMMIRLDPLLTLYTAGWLPILVVLFVRTGTVLDRRFEAVQKRISELNDALEACFSGIRVVKAYGREAAQERSFERFAVACREAEIAAVRSQTLMDSLYGQVWQLGIVAVLLAGGAAVISGRLTLGTFVAFDAYVLMLIWPMLDLGTFFVRGRQSGVSIGRLRELEETPPAITEGPDPIAPREPIRGHLALESVACAYDEIRPASIDTRPEGAPPGPRLTTASPSSNDRADGDGDGRGTVLEVVGRPAPASAGAQQDPASSAGPRSPYSGTGRREVLSDVSFRVAPGELVAVVGKVGSGKSTLLRLVPRLVDPVRGRVCLDGVDYRRLPLAPLRASVGYVPQEALLFSGTIRENIRFAREWVGEEEIAGAASVARLDRELAVFTEGLETRVGVRGVSLSGGQKQRVALARALAGRPRLLVLDDVTAALDAETEAALWEELHRVLPGLTTIVVTHRTSTLERADRILVLDGGHVVETGTHRELSSRGRVYRSIYRRHVLEERVGVEGAGDRVPDAEREPGVEGEA